MFLLWLYLVLFIGIGVMLIVADHIERTTE